MGAERPLTEQHPFFTEAVMAQKDDKSEGMENVRPIRQQIPHEHLDALLSDLRSVFPDEETLLSLRLKTLVAFIEALRQSPTAIYDLVSNFWLEYEAQKEEARATASALAETEQKLEAALKAINSLQGERATAQERFEETLRMLGREAEEKRQEIGRLQHALGQARKGKSLPDSDTLMRLEREQQEHLARTNRNHARALEDLQHKLQKLTETNRELTTLVEEAEESKKKALEAQLEEYGRIFQEALGERLAEQARGIHSEIEAARAALQQKNEELNHAFARIALLDAELVTRTDQHQHELAAIGRGTASEIISELRGLVAKLEDIPFSSESSVVPPPLLISPPSLSIDPDVLSHEIQRRNEWLEVISDRLHELQIRRDDLTAQYRSLEANQRFFPPSAQKNEKRTRAEKLAEEMKALDHQIQILEGKRDPIRQERDELQGLVKMVEQVRRGIPPRVLDRLLPNPEELFPSTAPVDLAAAEGEVISVSDETEEPLLVRLAREHQVPPWCIVLFTLYDALPSDDKKADLVTVTRNGERAGVIPYEQGVSKQLATLNPEACEILFGKGIGKKLLRSVPINSLQRIGDKTYARTDTPLPWQEHLPALLPPGAKEVFIRYMMKK
jgi:hypothetical protein